MKARDLFLMATLATPSCMPSEQSSAPRDAAVTQVQDSTATRVIEKLIPSEQQKETNEKMNVKKMVEEIESTYGVTVMYETFDIDYLLKVYEYHIGGRTKVDAKTPKLNLPDYTSIKKENLKKVLEYVKSRLEVLPPELVKKYGPKRIRLIQDSDSQIFTENQFTFADFSGFGGDDLLLTFGKKGEKYDDNMGHELFHTFDQHSAGGWGRDVRMWVKHTHELEQPIYPDKPRADACFNIPIERDMYAEFKTSPGCRSLFRKELRGYLTTYGFVLKPEAGDSDPTSRHVENKAEMAAILTTAPKATELDIAWFAERATEDRDIKNKLHLLTGCDFELRQNQYGRVSIYFTRLLTLDEYRTISGNKKQEFDYYRKWSTTEDGTVRMGPQYYNDIYNGVKIDASYWSRQNK